MLWQTGKSDQSLKFLEENKELNDNIKQIINELKAGYYDNTGVEYHEIKMKTECFTEWLKEGGANLKKIRMRHHAKRDQCVHVYEDIKQNDLILSVPMKYFITRELGRHTPMGGLLAKSGLNLDCAFYITLFLLEQFDGY